MFKQINYLNFRTRLTKWEYWPIEVVYLPVFLYYLYLSWKAKSFFFFSAANPSIKTGGMLGESKFSILQKLSPTILPKTIFVDSSISFQEVKQQLLEKQIAFPFIAKPDVGERGWMVEKIHTLAELSSYMQGIKVAFLIQEYIDYPLELGVFYYRFPDQQRGTISSIVIKEFLSLTGDGISTIEELIRQHERARLHYEVLKKKHSHVFKRILGKNDTYTLVPIGNHCRGTKFINGNHLITPALTSIFNQISQSIEGFYFGRYDIRCKSLHDLYCGKNIRILELNGAGAEPAHIYDPSFPFLKAYQVLFHHWSVMHQISRKNYRNGVKYMTLKEGLAIIKHVRNYRKLVNAI